MVVEESIKAIFLGKSRQWHSDSLESLVWSSTELAPVTRADCLSGPKGMAESSFPAPESRGKLPQLLRQFFFHVSGLKNICSFPFATESKS